MRLQAWPQFISNASSTKSVDEAFRHGQFHAPSQF